VATAIEDAVRQHVECFNEAVRTGVWAAFAARFADDGVLTFTNVPVGPFVGREAIRQAYDARPPDDTMTVLGVQADGPDAAIVRFRWDAGADGTMLLRWRDGLLIELVVTFD